MSTAINYEGGVEAPIVEAVETLANIVEWEREVGAQEQEYDLVVDGTKIGQRSIAWFPNSDVPQTISRVKDIFRVVLHYFRDLYKREYSYVENEQTIEGIKAIMVLVGEAAKKLDKYNNLVQGNKVVSIVELEEYKKLQEFYRKKIDQKIDQTVLSRWILGLSQENMPMDSMLARIDYTAPEMQSKHVFVDFESVKQDSEYELFFLRKEDGSRFFNPRLIRNIKLVCDFGGAPFLKENRVESLHAQNLKDVRIWRECVMQQQAKNILDGSRLQINIFLKKALRFKDRELVTELNKAIMALILCCNVSPYSEDVLKKHCSEYFKDFQTFLRSALSCREFHKLVAYPPGRDKEVSHCLLNLCHSLCEMLFLNLTGHKEFSATFAGLVEEAVSAPPENDQAVALRSPLLSTESLGRHFEKLTQLLKHYPNGPLVKVLDLLEEEGTHSFDSLVQNNLPGHWYSILWSGYKSILIKMPSPTHQEQIDKAVINDEFKCFLRSYAKGLIPKRHLVFNLQDRTSWREHARSSVLEELQKHEDFKKQLVVVTLDIDTDFYYQEASYAHVNQTETFVHQFEELLQDQNAGFLFPPELSNALFASFCSDLMQAVHKVFFGSKNVLSQLQRIDFIELFYVFLQLKVLEGVRPHSFSFTCKDAVDIGSTFSAKMFVILKLFNQEELSLHDLAYLDMIVFSSALLQRERVVQRERFQRMLAALKVVEHLRLEKGYGDFRKAIEDNFSPLYSTSLLDMKVWYP